MSSAIASVFMGHIHDENNGTTMDAQNALTTTGVGGLKRRVMEAYTWFANVGNLFKMQLGGTCDRKTYSLQTLSSSIKSTVLCTSTVCQEAKVCYMRSGSPPIAARCTKEN
ncbi:hypothetical protein JB92DRAFT_2836442 [Gautieria morchelliformis]|nr:hypothetical protein JB92DRAFT_2836442 [Gautieria morchelliformis]